MWLIVAPNGKGHDADVKHSTVWFFFREPKSRCPACSILGQLRTCSWRRVFVHFLWECTDVMIMFLGCRWLLRLSKSCHVWNKGAVKEWKCFFSANFFFSFRTHQLLLSPTPPTFLLFYVLFFFSALNGCQPNATTILKARNLKIAGIVAMPVGNKKFKPPQSAPQDVIF